MTMMSSCGLFVKEITQLGYEDGKRGNYTAGI